MALRSALGKIVAQPNVGRLKFVADDLAAGNYSGVRELEPGWVLCNGAAVPNSGVFTALYAMLGTTFGAAGTLPPIIDGRVAIPKGSSFAKGAQGGEIGHVLSFAEMSPHWHYYYDETWGQPGRNWDIDPWQPDHDRTGDYTSSSSAGGGGSHNNMNPYFVVGCVLVKY